MVYGRTGSARGCEKAASENCGTNKAYPELLTMYCTGRATTCRTLTIERGSSTRRYRVTVLTSSYHRHVAWIVDPPLPRDGTDLIPLRLDTWIVDPTLPRDGTDLIPLRPDRWIVDPTLPRDGTDLIDTAT